MSSMQHVYATLTVLAALWAGASASPLFACDNDGINSFVAHDRSLCTFYQCVFGQPRQVACAKGSRVPSYFTKGQSDPCIVKQKKNSIGVCDRCNVTDDPIPGPNKTNQCAQFRPCDARPGCKCVDQVAGYYCSCPPSVTAAPTPAHAQVQQCDFNVCKNGGTCYSLYKNQFCNCKPPFTGKRCETDACSELSCNNNGRCVHDNFTVYCECDPCYTGQCCEDKIVNCTGCPDCYGGRNCSTPKDFLCKCGKCPNATDSCTDSRQGRGPRQCAPAPDTAGSEFTLMFKENLGEANYKLEVYVSAATADGFYRYVIVDAPLMSYSESKVVEPNKVMKFDVDIGLHHTKTGKQNFGIRVRETNGSLVNVYCISRAAFSADGWLALPDKVAGKAFIVITYSPVTLAGQFAFVAIRNDTTVTINLANGTEFISGSSKDTVVVVHLNAWQTYQVQSRRAENDFTGTSIVSNNPIHVYSGEARGWVGPSNKSIYFGTAEALARANNKSRDILILECTSIETWGKTYALVPLPRTIINYTYSEEVVRIVSYVAASCTLYETKDALQHDERIITLRAEDRYYAQFYLNAAYNYFLSCNQPVMLVEITESSIPFDNNYNDPSFIYVPAVSSYSNYYHFSPPEFSGGSSSSRPYTYTYVRLIATESAYQNIEINGERLLNMSLETLKNWTRIYVPNAGSSRDFPALYGCIVRISSSNSTSINHLSKDVKFAAIVEGFDDRESYGIVLGASIKPQNSSFNVESLRSSGNVVANIL